MEQSERLVLHREATEPGSVLTVCEVANLYLRRAAGDAETVLGHVDRHGTADDVAPGAQPGARLELEPQRD